MTDSSHIDDLRRRVQKDPASIAFAQLAEELRRSGALQDAVDVCREGLRRHPSYISAHVTLGRSLLQLGQLDEARAELEQVQRDAPDNLAALRALADIRQRQGSPAGALEYFEKALRLAPNDPALERLVAAIGPDANRAADAAADRSARTILALEQWLTAIHVSRA